MKERKAQAPHWSSEAAQEIYEWSANLAIQLHLILSSDPDMPSHDRTIKEAETVLSNYLQHLRAEDLMTEDLRECA